MLLKPRLHDRYMILFIYRVMKIQIPGDRKHGARGKGFEVTANEFSFLSLGN